MNRDTAILLIRIWLVWCLGNLGSLWPANDLSAETRVLEPLRLSYQGSSDEGLECLLHAPSSPQAGSKDESRKGPPPALQESEHRPVAKREYYFNEHRRRAIVRAYVRRPDGGVIEPELRLGYKPRVSFATPFGDGPVHGANSVYVVEEGVDEAVLIVRTAKWITMHHNCGWGHDGKFDEHLISPQPLATIPFEIVVDTLWDQNFHFSLASGDRMGIAVLSYGRPVAGAKVSLLSAEGWSKTVVTDQDGRTTIQMIRDYYPSLWSKFKRTHRGEFLLTAHYHGEEKGSFRGSDYQRLYYITTLPGVYTPALSDYGSYAYGLFLVLLAMVLSAFGVYLYRERRRKPYKGISFDE